MAKEINYSSIAMARPQLLGVFGIIREALRIPFRSAKLMLSITLFMILSNSLLILWYLLFINPMISDLFRKSSSLPTIDPLSPEYAKMLMEIKTGIKILMGVQVIFIAAAFVVSVFTMIAILYVSVRAYSGKQSSLNELLLTIRQTWKRLLITWLYVIVLGTGNAVILVVVVGVLFGIANGSFLLVALGFLLPLLALLLYIYLAVVWILGLVISVVEEGYSGIKALGKAEELIKGRTLQGFFLALLISLVSIITVIAGYMMGDVHRTARARLVIRIVGIPIACGLKIVYLAAYAVYYYECKKSHGEEVELQGDMGYSKVPTGSPC